MPEVVTTRRRRARRGAGENLQAEILDAAKALLVETGSADAVSIRAVAERVGVTSPSIYLHFADKDALIEAVLVDYFQHLDEAMQAATEGVTSAVERARAQGLAYIKFALDNPEHYRLACMSPKAKIGDLDHVLGTTAFAHLVDTVHGLMREGLLAEDDPIPTALQMWVTVHGVASLIIAKPFLPWGDPLEFADRVMAQACVGHSVLDLVGYDTDPATVLERLRRT